MKFKSSFWLWLGLAAAAVVLLVAWLHGRYPDTLSSRDGQISLVHGFLILAFVGSSLLIRGRTNIGHVVRNAALWVAIGGLILIGYSFRQDIQWLAARLTGEINPSAGTANDQVISFPVSRGGHFLVDATVDGVPVRFLVDTGASDVVLSPADAQRIGFDPSSMAFTQIYETANGTVSGAPVRLGYIELGPIRVEDVRASVNGADMDRSLLGMSFLKRLSGYDVTNDTLTLRR